MARIKRHLDRWADALGLPESPAWRAVTVLTIAIVPGAGVAWMTWRVLKTAVDAR